jgi:tight adherence protein B
MRCSTVRAPEVGSFVGLVLGLGVLLMWRSGPRAPQRADRLRRRSQRRVEMLRQAGISGVGPGQLALIQLGAGVLAFGAVVVLTSTATVALCFGAFGAALPVVLVRRARRRRQAALRDVWPDAIDHLTSAVRAGLSLPEGLAALGERGPVELRPQFRAFASRHRQTGRFGEALDQLKAELADPVGDRVCETLRVARAVGGSDLGRVLRTLSELLRTDARTRSELETRQGWVVNGARLAVAAPWIVLLLLGTQSSTLHAYDSRGGTVLLFVGAAACVAAYRIMLFIGRLPDEPRVLR